MGRGLFEGWNWIIIILLLVVLFGFKRLPDAARSLGRSMRVFKSEVDEMKAESRSDASTSTVAGERVPNETPRADPVRDAEGGRADGQAVREDTPPTDNGPRA